MGYTFTDGEIATKAKLDLAIPGRISQSGMVRLAPAANTPTSLWVPFPTPFPSAPHVLATPVTDFVGSQVKGVSVTDVSTSGFRLWLYRTNTTGTSINWQAFAPTVAFTDGQPAYAGLLNQAGTALVAKSGTVTITPTANTPTAVTVTFPSAYAATPIVTACPVVTVPGSEVKGVAVTAVTRTSFKVAVYRTNTTATDVSWLALGRL